MLTHIKAQTMKARRAGYATARKAESLIQRGAPVAARLALAVAAAFESDLARAELAQAARVAYAADSKARRAFRR